MSDDLLYPLSLFRQNDGRELPSFEVIDGAAMPEPYRSLLVHNGDMTSRLESFHQGRIVLEVLHREQTAQAYRREVVLHVEEVGTPVEYGAIEIDLTAFDGQVREAILEAHLPLGGVLNHFRVSYRSEPRAYIKLGQDAIMDQLFGVADAVHYGRSNVLLGDDDRVLARIVEVLRP
jgi:chorismate-pyruvate lyase